MSAWPGRISRARLRALGVGPGVRCCEVGAGAGTIARWLATAAGAAEGMLATGLIDAERLDEACESLASGTAADLSPGLITAWGRLP